MGIPPVLLAVAESHWSATVCLIVFGGAALAVSVAAVAVTRRHLTWALRSAA